MICCTTVSAVIICVSKGWQLSIVNILVRVQYSREGLLLVNGVSTT